ncbi:putative dienelactone hydrolase [Alkalihalobacillus xiaoxiensis]|uniref:Dienelactone hydrolase n=1 Tax=Shouchella xiaoxiensis TaxID=766895 RepID=A0ABS2STN0_9BACI|nr:hypothetical protein [Shouchella xiaoxiensis]MBM7838885.1 putative dienelactone hydrolase [Shouchella xiaoxiensis]
MILLEMVLAGLILFTILLQWTNVRKKLILITIIGQWVTLIALFVDYGWRWPMIPLYFLTLFVTVKMIPTAKASTIRNKVILATFVVFALFLPGILFPWYSFSEPTGEYAVGTSSYEVVDSTREERWLNNEDNRRLMVQFWYPTDDTRKEQARYHNHPALFMNEFGKENGIPGFLLQSFAKQRTHAHSDATLLNQEQPYPVLFFSHGFGSNRGQSQFQVAELASHGYIVIAIDHTYYSPGTVFADGSNPGVASIEFNEDESVMDDYAYEWSADARSVMNWLEDVESGHYMDTALVSQFSGNLDLTRVGYLGHSFGGASASHTLAVDERFHAGINMDGFPYGDAAELGVTQPFLTLTSDQDILTSYIEDEEYLSRYFQQVEAISGPDKVHAIPGAMHLDFSDIPLLSPITSWFGMTGKDNQHKFINKLTLEFFNDTLN